MLNYHIFKAMYPAYEITKYVKQWKYVILYYIAYIISSLLTTTQVLFRNIGYYYLVCRKADFEQSCVHFLCTNYEVLVNLSGKESLPVLKY